MIYVGDDSGDKKNIIMTMAMIKITMMMNNDNNIDNENNNDDNGNDNGDDNEDDNDYDDDDINNTSASLPQVLGPSYPAGKKD